MGTYLLQSSFTLSVLYLIYWFFVKHQQNFNFNRIFILFIILISGLLPLFEFNLFIATDNKVADVLEPVIVTDFSEQYIGQNANKSTSIFAIVYIIGLLAFAIRSVAGLATLLIFYWRYPKRSYRGFTIVFLSGEQSPFTFFNVLFINESDFRKDQLNELVVHEEVHRNQYHSMDLILMELVTIIHWFNPFVWLIKKDLKSEHEFLVDEQVINEGFDKTRYQSLLLQAHKGMALYLANSFNYSILKKRLVMMTKQKTARNNWKYAFAVPSLILATSILFLNFQFNAQRVTSPDVLPEYKTGEKNMYSVIQKAIKYPLESRKSNTQGTVYTSFTVTKDGNVKDIKSSDKRYNLMKEMVVIGYYSGSSKKEIEHDFAILQDECERVVGLLGDFIPAKQDDRPVETRMTIPITFKIQ